MIAKNRNTKQRNHAGLPRTKNRVSDPKRRGKVDELREVVESYRRHGYGDEDIWWAAQETTQEFRGRFARNEDDLPELEGGDD